MDLDQIFQKIGTTQTLSQKIERNIERAIREKKLPIGSKLPSERELCEMFGLYLEDHPNPNRLITNPKFTTPLLKTVKIRGREEVWNR